MPFELSPEAMRSPLRSVTITIAAGDQGKLLDQLRLLADRYRFARRFSTDPAKPGETFVQLYRTDIKMIGRLSVAEQRLDVTVYRTLHRVPVEGIEQGVAALRQIASELPDARFEQTVFVRGDDMSLEPRTGIAPVRAARITHVDGAQAAILKQLAIFAEANGYAARFTQTTPDPKDLVVNLYSESLDITVDKAFTNEKMDALVYRTGDRTASQTLIDHTFDELRTAIEKVPGVSFTARP